MDENSVFENEVIVSIQVKDTHGNKVSKAFGFSSKTTKTVKISSVGEAMMREMYSQYIGCLQELSNARMLQLRK